MEYTKNETDMMKRYFLKEMRNKKIEHERKTGRVNTTGLIIPNPFCEIEIRGDYVHVDNKLFGDCI